MEIPDKNRQFLMQKLLDAVKQVSVTLFLDLKCFFSMNKVLVTIIMYIKYIRVIIINL